MGDTGSTGIRPMNWVVGFVPPIDEPRTKSLEGPGPSETLGFVNGSLPRHSSVILIHEWNRVAMRPSPASDSTRRGGGEPRAGRVGGTRGVKAGLDPSYCAAPGPATRIDLQARPARCPPREGRVARPLSVRSRQSGTPSHSRRVGFCREIERLNFLCESLLEWLV